MRYFLIIILSIICGFYIGRIGQVNKEKAIKVAQMLVNDEKEYWNKNWSKTYHCLIDCQVATGFKIEQCKEWNQ